LAGLLELFFFYTSSGVYGTNGVEISTPSSLGVIALNFFPHRYKQSPG
jgi:hypothetical protein